MTTPSKLRALTAVGSLARGLRAVGNKARMANRAGYAKATPQISEAIARFKAYSAKAARA